MLLAYADDIDIVGQTLREVTAVFEKVEKESAQVGLAVNGDKIKWIVSTTKISSRIGSQVEVENLNFEVVNDFIYLGIVINKTNDVSFK